MNEGRDRGKGKKKKRKEEALVKANVMANINPRVSIAELLKTYQT